MTQLALDLREPLVLRAPSAPRARRTDPSTSHAAAKKAEKFATGHFALIRNTLKDHGPGTYKEIAGRCGLERHAVGRRLKDMREAGLIRATDAERDGCTVMEAVT